MNPPKTKMGIFRQKVGEKLHNETFIAIFLCLGWWLVYLSLLLAYERVPNLVVGKWIGIQIETQMLPSGGLSG